MLPLTGNGWLNKDLAEEHQRDLLEEAQAAEIAKGDKEALEGENYQPVTDNKDDLVHTRERNKRVNRNEK
jgi:hypothetical protein